MVSIEAFYLKGPGFESWSRWCWDGTVVLGRVSSHNCLFATLESLTKWDILSDMEVGQCDITPGTGFTVEYKLPGMVFTFLWLFSVDECKYW